MINKRYYEDPIKFSSIINSNKIKCECGHSIFLGKRDRQLCSWCGNWVFKDKSTEFKYRLKEKILKELSNGN